MKLALTILLAVLPLLCGAQSLSDPAFVAGLTSPATASYTANTAVFDGSNDYMNFTSSGPTGLADGKQLTFSGWVKLAANSQYHTLFHFSTPADGLRWIGARIENDSTIRFVAWNSSTTAILNINTTETVTVADGWVHIYACFDLADAAKRKIYKNGSACTLTVTTWTNDTIDFVGTNYRYYFGADFTAGNIANAAFAEIWMDDSYLDSPTSFASGGHPISLGSDGSTPTGSQPVFYLKGDGNGFNVNSGTGGNFTITGSLGTTTPP